MREGVFPGWGPLGPTVVVDTGGWGCRRSFSWSGALRTHCGSGYGWLGVREGVFPGREPLGPTVVVDTGGWGCRKEFFLVGGP